jgi:hypothetical protein
MSLDGRVETQMGDPYGAVLGGEMDLLGTDGKWCNRASATLREGKGMDANLGHDVSVSHNMGSYSGDSERDR